MAGEAGQYFYENKMKARDKRSNPGKGAGMIGKTGFLIVLIMAALILPAAAIDVSAGVEVLTNTNDMPFVKAGWVEDLTTSREDGDPTHVINGSQFLPPCVFGAAKRVRYYLVVSDEQDKGYVKEAFAEIYNPDGTYASKTTLVRLAGSDEPATFQSAVAAGLAAFRRGEDPVTVIDDLSSGRAAIWYGEGDLTYCQRDGDYPIRYYAFDTDDNRADLLPGMLTYVPVVCAETDFTSINYGSVSPGVRTWRAGDLVFDPGVGLTPTVRNIGNTQVYVTIRQDDMGFGKDYNGNWKVSYDARLGTNGREINYNPNEEVTLPNILGRCRQEELDYSIHVVKGRGKYTGNITIGFKEVKKIVNITVYPPPNLRPPL